MELPRRIKVQEVVSSRYPAGSRPVSWDERLAGREVVVTSDGESITLHSAGGQSSPAPGWELLLTKEVGERGQNAVLWTLFGIEKQGGLEKQAGSS